jgi:hypothetical protein
VLVVVGAGLGSGLDPLTILMKEITVRGSFTYIDEFDDAIELLAAGQIKVADLTTGIVPLDQALTAMESLRTAQTMKVLVDPTPKGVAPCVSKRDNTVPHTGCGRPSRVPMTLGYSAGPKPQSM